MAAGSRRIGHIEYLCAFCSAIEIATSINALLACLLYPLLALASLAAVQTLTAEISADAAIVRLQTRSKAELPDELRPEETIVRATVSGGIPHDSEPRVSRNCAVAGRSRAAKVRNNCASN